jgi:hypothetical protein
LRVGEPYARVPLITNTCPVAGMPRWSVANVPSVGAVVMSITFSLIQIVVISPSGQWRMSGRLSPLRSRTADPTDLPWASRLQGRSVGAARRSPGAEQSCAAVRFFDELGAAAALGKSRLTTPTARAHSRSVPTSQLTRIEPSSTRDSAQMSRMKRPMIGPISPDDGGLPRGRSASGRRLR